MTQSLPLKAYGALFVVYLVWGTTMAAMHVGVESIPPALLACARFTLSGLLLVGVCSLLGHSWPRLDELKQHALVGFLLFFGGNSISCWALQYIPTGLGGMLVATMPFWMVGLSTLGAARERVMPLTLVGLLIGFVGMVILLSPQWIAPQAVSPMFWPSIGGMLVLCFFWSAGSLVARRLQSRTSLLMGLGVQNLFAGLMLLPFSLAAGDFNALQPTAASLSALLYLIFFGTILATPCYYYVLRSMPVSVASTFAYVTPIITVLFGWLAFGEALSWSTLAGSAVILAGVLLVQNAPPPQPVPHAMKGIS
jgi:drug/metabolite transporter (DMT)-like permease